MLANIAKFGCFVSHPEVWAPIGILGFCLINQKIFGRALLLVMFTMVYNTLLKSIWQEPLPEPMQGWAFPSGHMHSAVVFWGWLTVEYRKVWFSAVVYFMLILVGYGLIYEGYHYPHDVVGAIAFGSLSITIYYCIQRLAFLSTRPYRLGFLLILLSLTCISLTIPEGRKPHIWQGLGGMIGFTISWMLCFNKSRELTSLTSYGLQAMKTMLGAFALLMVIGKLPLSLPIMNFVKLAVLGLWVPYSTCLFKPQKALMQVQHLPTLP